MKKILSLLLCILFLSGCVPSKEALAELFREAYEKQIQTDRYQLTGLVELNNDQDLYYPLEYDIRIDKKNSDDQGDDVLYLNFYSKEDYEPDYEAWIEGKGYGYYDYGNEKEIRSSRIHFGSVDDADELIEMFDLITLTKQDDIRILSMKVKDSYAVAIIEQLRKHLVFDALLIDLAGTDGIKEIEINELIFHIDEDGNIVKFMFNGQKTGGGFTMAGDLDITVPGPSVPSYKPDDFAANEDYSGLLEDYMTYNGGSYVIMAMMNGVIQIDMRDKDRFYIEYVPDEGAIVISDVNNRNNIYGYYAPLSQFRDLYPELVAEFEEGNSDYIEVIDKKMMIMEDEYAPDHQGTRYYAKDKNSGEMVCLDVYDDIELGILYMSNCSEEMFRTILNQTIMTFSMQE